MSEIERKLPSEIFNSDIPAHDTSSPSEVQFVPAFSRTFDVSEASEAHLADTIAALGKVRKHLELYAPHHLLSNPSIAHDKSPHGQ